MNKAGALILFSMLAIAFAAGLPTEPETIRWLFSCFLLHRTEGLQNLLYFTSSTEFAATLECVGLLASHPTASDGLLQLYNLNEAPVRRVINSLLGASGETFAELAAHLNSLPKEKLKEIMTNAAEQLFQYIGEIIKNGSANQLQNIQVIINELTDFAEVYEDDCRAAQKQLSV